MPPGWAQEATTYAPGTGQSRPLGKPSQTPNPKDRGHTVDAYTQAIRAMNSQEADTPAPEEGTPMAHGAHVQEPEARWYTVTIAGNQFDIASRKGESHIRQVESLLDTTHAEVAARAVGQPPHNLALLTALNLADQLLELRNQRQGNDDLWNQRVSTMVDRLQRVLDEAISPAVQYPQE